MPTLYYSPRACSLAVHVVLEWIGEPYDIVKVDIHHPDPAYTRINPAGAVPAFDHGGGEALTQCAAILNYLALKHPEVDLLDERSPEHRAELVKWTSFLTGDLHPAFWPVFLPGRYTTNESASARDGVKAAGLKLVRAKLALLDRQVGGHGWIVGDKRTIVDAYATPMLAWAASMLPGGLADYPSLRSHREHMLSDPAVRRAMAAEDLPNGGANHEHT